MSLVKQSTAAGKAGLPAKMSKMQFKYDGLGDIQNYSKPYTTLKNNGFSKISSWMKFARPLFISFVGRDVLCVANGCQILLHSLLTGEERILNVTGANGEGVAAISGHKTHPLLAYAEKRASPRVFLVTYPATKFAGTLTSNFYELTQLVFSDGELLFGMSGYPECALIVWKWRTGEVLATQDTNMFFNHNSFIKASYTTQPVYLAQVVKNTSEMRIWEVCCCGRKCIVRNKQVIFDIEDPRLRIMNFLWSPETCFALDSHGNVFMYEAETYTMRFIIRSESEADSTTAFCWYQNGLIVQSADRKIRYYPKNTNWTVAWMWEQEYPIQRMYTTINRDHIILLTSTKDLLRCDPHTRNIFYLRDDEACITHFGFVPPRNETVITLGRSRVLSMWDAVTGELIQSMKFDSDALCMRINDRYPYAAVSFDNGWLHLYACIKRTLEKLARFHLGHLPLHQVRFFESHQLIGVANMDVGQVFLISGVPGTKFKVLSSATHQAQIADFIAIGGKACLRLFMIPVTSNRYLAGNKIVRYCIVRHQETTAKTYELENEAKFYMGLHALPTHRAHRDRLLYAVPMETKLLHELEVKRGDTHARIVNRWRSSHMLRGIYYHFDTDYVLSYGYDGLVIVRAAGFEEIQHVLLAHHRFDGGLRGATWDAYHGRMLTLGRDGLLMCNQLAGGPWLDAKQQVALFALSEELNDMFKTPTIGFHPRGIHEGFCWLEYQKSVKIERERVKYELHRMKIVQTLEAIRKQAVVLLDHNLYGPKEERLELQDFNLNLQHKEELIKNTKEECERWRRYLDRLIEDQDRISRVMMARFWDPIATPTKSLWALFANSEVQSYAVLPPDRQLTKALELLEGYRVLEHACAKDDAFKPWMYYTDKEREIQMAMQPRMALDKQTVTAMIEADEESEAIVDHVAEWETYVSYFGSTVPTYISMDDMSYEQPAMQTFLQYSFVYTISLGHQQKLRDFFNANFERLVQSKVREVVTVIERNARLRYIISELNYFSERQYAIEARDPEWRQDEEPARITTVTNDEVGILPYISPSEQAFLDAKIAEEERIRLLLMADDFKERALMKMMNGVLEVRWEDELRREIPLPKCYAEKDPADFNEEDLKSIKEYEEAVAFLDSERCRYIGILEAEYQKIGALLREGVKKFNERLQELLVQKLQIESAITSELLRMHRMREKGQRRNAFVLAEADALQKFRECEVHIEDTTMLVATLAHDDRELKIMLDSLVAREKIVERNFKKEFQDLSPAQFEVIAKLYKKRPKINMKAITSPSTLEEMARVVSTFRPSLLLFGEPLEFVQNVDQMDKYIGIPLIIDQATYASLVRIRRLKIEMELKIGACKLEIAEGETTQRMFEASLARCREHGVGLLARMDDVRAQKLRDALDVELQLVVKQEFVELPRTGSRRDFFDAVLVNRQEVEDINALILCAGGKKLTAMRSALQFRKEIAFKEWEHQRMKMTIADLEHQIVDIHSMPLTKEIQHFLKMRHTGNVSEKTMSFDHDLERLRDRYQVRIRERKRAIAELKVQLDALVSVNEQLNSDIRDVNINVIEANMRLDESLTKKEGRCIHLRIQWYLKRSRLVNQIQENHSQIMMMQTELELARLRTVPIIDYKVDV